MLTAPRAFLAFLLMAIGTVTAVPASAAAASCSFGVVCQVQSEHAVTTGGTDASTGSGSTRQYQNHLWGVRFEEDYFASLAVVEGRHCARVTVLDPQPPRSDAVWGGRDFGVISECMVYNHTTRLVSPRRFWSGSLAEVPASPPPPDPVMVAQRAVSQMGLSSIDIGIVPEDQPGRVGVIGLPVWLWVADPGPTTTGPVTTSATVAIWTVTATATLDRIEWDMGDGTTVTCTTAGTPYADGYGTAPSPDYGHRYTTPGTYTVAATSHWTVTWSGIGRTGTFPLQYTSTTTITEAEIQVLNQ